MKINPIIFQEIESECRTIVLDFLKNDRDFLVQPFKSFISSKTEAKTCAIFWDKTKFKRKMDDSFFDKYLGSYVHHGNGHFEGHINMYPENILNLVLESKTSNKLHSDFKQLEFFKSVCRVVLLHELSHWLIHFVSVGGILVNHYNENYIKMSTFQHEQLAQICTASMLKRKIDNYTMGYLMQKSAEEYKLEPELLWVEPSLILSVIKDFRFPVLFKRIKDERPFTEVYFSLLRNKNQPVLSMKQGKELDLY
jgi:hypothetical protein